VLTDSKGAGDFGVVNVLVNNFIDGRQACYLAYVSSSNTLSLVDDAGDAGGPFAGSLSLNGGAATIQNSQCSVSGAGSSAMKSGNTLTLTLSIAFSAAFAGDRIVWVAGRDAAGANNTDWQALGTLTVNTAISVTFYVAPNGKDSWSGTLAAPNGAGTDGPFATIDSARAAVQPLNKAGLSQVAVQFRAGTYFLPATEIFTAADSGTAATEIVYQNYPGESPAISGGVRVQNWINVSGNTWKATLPASTRYFEQLFYNGVRRLRPRLGGYLGTYYRFVGPVYLNAPPPPASAPEPNCQVYITGSGWQCFDRFLYNSADPISLWRNLAPPAGNPCGQPAGNPALTGDIELVDFEKYSTPKLRISCVDPASNIVYLTGSPLTYAVFANVQGFLPNHRYLIENVQDQLTQPGQWFLDRSTTPWMLTYLAASGENPNADTVIVPQVTEILVASNLQYVTFLGLTFEHDNYTLPAAGEAVPDLGLNITAAVSFQNSQHITFDSGVVAHTSGGGLEFISCITAQSPSWCIFRSTSAVTSGNVVSNSALYDLGFVGIRIGMPALYGQTDANIPQFNTVENNVVEGYGRVFPDTSGIRQGEGHDNTYTHNEVYDGYHAAIALCFCSGDTRLTPDSHDNIVSFNHVYDLFQGISNDGGSIYIQTANFVSPMPAGNRILNNRVHDVSDASALDADGYGGEGVYIDTLTGLVDVENNLVYRVSASPMNFSSAPANPSEANTIKNNIFAFGRLSMVAEGDAYLSGTVPPSQIQVFVATNNLFYFDRSSASSPGFYVQSGGAYSGGFAFTTWEQWNSNLYWRTDGGFASDAHAFHVQPYPNTTTPCYYDPSKWTFLTLAAWQSLGEDIQSVVQDPGFANPSYPADDYSLPKGSPGIGFVVFDPSQAGPGGPIPGSIHPRFPRRFPRRISIPRRISSTLTVGFGAFAENPSLTVGAPMQRQHWRVYSRLLPPGR